MNVILYLLCLISSSRQEVSNSLMLSFYHTIAPSYRCTVVRCTVMPLYRHTVAPSYRCTVVPIFHCTVKPDARRLKPLFLKKDLKLLLKFDLFLK